MGVPERVWVPAAELRAAFRKPHNRRAPSPAERVSGDVCSSQVESSQSDLMSPGTMLAHLGEGGRVETGCAESAPQDC